MANILGVGITTLDIINTTDGYPDEDSEVRAIKHTQRRGGNAANTLAVLNQLGHHCSLAGSLADDGNSEIILQDMADNDINTGYCRKITGGRSPTSYITVNQHNGSRTIVHYRDIPEFDFEDFKRIELDKFDWVHFEGRNVIETKKMIGHLKRTAPNLDYSIEIEKPHNGIESLYTNGTVLIFSRYYVIHASFNDPTQFLESIRSINPESLLVCTWGPQGAYALDTSNQHTHAPTSLPEKTIDTIGAGDTFNAAFLDAYINGKSINEMLVQANFVAGQKCGQYGFKGLSHKSLV